LDSHALVITKPFMLHAAWALLAIIAFAAGYSFSDRRGSISRESEPPSSHFAVERPSRTLDDRRPMPAPASARVAITPEEARLRTFELLAEPNRVERMRQLCELLPSVTSGNWRNVLAAFDLQMHAEGRKSTDNWDIILERIGEVAGAAALDEALSGAGPVDQHQVGWILKGWLAKNLKEGMQWFATQPAATQQWLINDFVIGVSRTDPQQAVTMAGQQSQNVWHTTIPFILANTVQLGGLRANDELLRAIGNRTDIPDPMKGDAFGNTALRHIDIARTGDQPLSVLDWANQYVGQEFMGPNASREIVAFAADRDPRATMNWIDAHRGKWTPRQEAAVYPLIGQVMQTKAPEEFAAWINGNPDHPQRDLMLEGASRYWIQSGNLEEARRLTNSVSDPQVRARLEQSVRQLQSNLQRRSQAPSGQ
jgi:hypothetical protein